MANDQNFSEAPKKALGTKCKILRTKNVKKVLNLVRFALNLVNVNRFNQQNRMVFVYKQKQKKILRTKFRVAKTFSLFWKTSVTAYIHAATVYNI